MLAQVKFIWTSYQPSEEQLNHLEFLQAEIRNFYWLSYKETKNNYELAIKLQSMHKKLRRTLHIVKN